MHNANVTAPADLQLALARALSLPSPQQWAVNKAVERAALRARFSGKPAVKPRVFVRATESEIVEAPKPKAARARCAGGFSCQECGHKFRTVKAAERAYFGNGCPKCGGADIGEAA